MNLINKIDSGELDVAIYKMIDGQGVQDEETDAAEEKIVELARVGERTQWIPVIERMPEHNQVVDVMYDHRRETDVLFTDLGWKQYFWNPKMGRFIDGVTHWTPLPEPPQGVE